MQNTAQAFAEQANLRLLPIDSIVPDLQTNALQGSFEVPEALRLWLEGSPCTGRVEGLRIEIKCAAKPR